MTITKVVSDDALLPVKEASPIVQAKVTRLYQLLNSGQLRAKKVGRRTLVTGESINQYLSDLPDYRPRRRDV